MTALIGFVRELVKELNARADLKACDQFNPESDAAVVVLREIAGALGVVAKRTFLA